MSAKMTKNQIVAALQEANIEFVQNARIAELRELYNNYLIDQEDFMDVNDCNNDNHEIEGNQDDNDLENEDNDGGLDIELAKLQKKKKNSFIAKRNSRFRKNEFSGTKHVFY